jgi:hypothetical protein
LGARRIRRPVRHSQGIVFAEQPAHAVEAVRLAVGAIDIIRSRSGGPARDDDAHRLRAAGFAVARRAPGAQEAWAAAHVDEDSAEVWAATTTPWRAAPVAGPGAGGGTVGE